MPDRVRHDGEKRNDFLNYDTVSEGQALGYPVVDPGIPRGKGLAKDIECEVPKVRESLRPTNFI
jgi:hypothetical protein